MTYTYDDTALDEDLNRIRLEIGDTNSKRQLLQDEEIEQIMEEQSTFPSRVARCCRLIASLFASKPQSIKLEGFSETTTAVFDRYIKLAKKYEAIGSAPWAGSIDVDFKAATELDTSIVHPKFKLGLMDN